MSRLSYTRVLVELDFFVDLKSSVDIILPNGAPLTQPVVHKPLARFCKLCKVLGHKTGVCSSTTASTVIRHMGNKGISSEASDKPRSVFDRLGPVAEPSLGSVEG
ncbi:hypothetical protein Peur_000775 [Populus x canadensis]